MRDRALNHERRAHSKPGETGRCHCVQRQDESESSAFHSGTLDAVTIVSDLYLRRKLSASLTRIGIRHCVHEPTQRRAIPEAALYCLCTRAVATLGAVPLPALVLCCGLTVSDKVVSLVARASVPIIETSNLTDGTLLQAIVSATSGAPWPLALKLYLASHPIFRQVPAALIDSFVAAPSGMTRLSDICAALRVSRANCRTLLRSAGFERGEHLCTALRAEAWIWFEKHGLRRGIFETYLGIRDRTTFRRACCRAAVSVPWTGGPPRKDLFASRTGKTASKTRSALPYARLASSGAIEPRRD